jgi:FtsH-binding integral membrane protein
MTHSNDLTTRQPTPLPAVFKQMLIGAGIGLILISIFVLGVKYPNPAWGKFWMIKPLLVTPFVGSLCGACFHIMHRLRQEYSWNRAFVICVSIFGYIIGLWLGVVLGLNGTMWD